MNQNCLKTILEKKKFIYHCIEENPSKTSYLIKFEMKTCHTDFIIEQSYTGNKLIFLYAIFPVKVPTHKLKDMAIFSTLLNNNLSYGCWELNMKDGTLRFRISYLYKNNDVDFEKHFMDNMEHAIQYTDICSHSLLSLMFSNALPQEVFKNMTHQVNIMQN